MIFVSSLNIITIGKINNDIDYFIKNNKNKENRY